ncbi:MAG TPA: formyltransferase family protein [Candidatus Binatia bacterium]|nr:formyltransferase family protein [Candidatus Binatia bacterium]
MNAAQMKKLVRGCQNGAYLRPGNLRLAVAQLMDVERNLRVYSEREHLEAAAGWLKRAQDATADGGFVGRYSLKTGWSSSYPETTGYIVPTLLKLADQLQDEEFLQRAQRAIDFLLSVQLANGAFPGAEIVENTSRPSPFNTAQIMHGLQAWTERMQDERCRAALQRAGNWLCEIQDSTGAWRKFFYQDLATTYSAHLTCWLAEAGDFLGDSRMLEAASRHLQWVLQHYDAEHAWFDLCGFSREDHELRRSVTHTIAYTVWGVLRSSEVLNSAEGNAAAEKAAYAAMRRLELSRRLPGVLDYRWRPQAAFTCLTGNAQMALIWLHLYRQNGDPRLLNAALKAIDMVKAAQAMEARDSGVRGGIAGSQPLWGDYIPHAFPNWAVKYFIDALLEKRQALEADVPFRSRPVPMAEPVPAALPAMTKSGAQGARPRVALLTSQVATKVMEFCEAWSAWGFRPDLVVIERWPSPPFWSRVRKRMREGRLLRLPGFLPRAHGAENGSGDRMPAPSSVLQYCQAAGMPAVEVDSINSAKTAELLRQHGIGLCVYAGAGILREQVIEAAPLGVLNAHMGLLPAYRGMNVAEWAAWNGDAAGCSVHLIDGGIDTGDILLVRAVDVSEAANIAQLRRLVDRSQIGLLGDVVRYVLASGKLPPRRRQTAGEGAQYFTMHGALVERLNERLGLRAMAAVSGSS